MNTDDSKYQLRHVKPRCANCERLEKTLFEESTFLGVANNGWSYEEQKNERLEKKLEMCKEALEFYSTKTNWHYDRFFKEDYDGVSGGKRARECLAKLEKE